MYTNRKEGGGAGWQGDFVEELLVQRWKRERWKGNKAAELATDEHGKTRKQQKQRHGNEVGKAAELATEGHGKTWKQQKQRHGNSRRIIG